MSREAKFSDRDTHEFFPVQLTTSRIGNLLPSAGTFNMPTSYQLWGWGRKENINWSMVTCQDSTRLELP